MSESGVYQILNTANGQRYVGSSLSIRKRWYQHRKHLKIGTHHSPHLQRSWDIHGREAFQFSVLVLCREDTTLLWEQMYMDALRPEYNCLLAAGSRRGVKHSQETKDRIRAIHAGRKGLPMSEANKLRVGAWRKAKIVTPETRAKMSAARKGSITSEATKSKISALLSGRKKTPEQVVRSGKANATISEDQVRDIRYRLNNGVRLKDVSSALNISFWTVSDISRGKNYAWVN